jgi:rhodanese-related sulfurtransferase/DNA-binding transcriptional ArsR family regulator
MPARAFKEMIYEQFARVGQALSSPRRLELLDLLGQAPRTVEAIAAEASMSVANTSQHLQLLRAAGLAEATKNGLYVRYRLAGDDVAQMVRSLHRVAQRHRDEVQILSRTFFLSGDELEPIDAGELVERSRRGDVAILDVRPAEEYAVAHLPGAISLPLPELAARLGELPAGKDIVAYCRGPYCVLAVEAVRLLRRHGWRARRLEDGVREWAERGLPVEGAHALPGPERQPDGGRDGVAYR